MQHLFVVLEDVVVVLGPRVAAHNEFRARLVTQSNEDIFEDAAVVYQSFWHSVPLHVGVRPELVAQRNNRGDGNLKLGSLVLCSSALSCVAVQALQCTPRTSRCTLTLLISQYRSSSRSEPQLGSTLLRGQLLLPPPQGESVAAASVAPVGSSSGAVEAQA
jgi:hypothetical protein